jgi:hypothetical protein
MSESGRNDLIEISDNAHPVTNPKREEEQYAEIHRRLEHVSSNYRACRQAFGYGPSFNQSLAGFRKAPKEDSSVGRTLTRAHPELEVVVGHKARRHAADRTGIQGSELSEADVAKAAAETAAALKPRRGRPDDAILRYHVEALVALFQEMTGKPILVRRDRRSEYDPHPANPMADVFIQVVQRMEPAATKTAIILIVRAARRRYADKPMRFFDFFPNYGVRIDQETGELQLRPGWKVEHLEWAPPIYFPSADDKTR